MVNAEFEQYKALTLTTDTPRFKPFASRDTPAIPTYVATHTRPFHLGYLHCYVVSSSIVRNRFTTCISQFSFNDTKSFKFQQANLVNFPISQSRPAEITKCYSEAMCFAVKIARARAENQWTVWYSGSNVQIPYRASLGSVSNVLYHLWSAKLQNKEAVWMLPAK